MLNKKFLSQLKLFDPELCDALKFSFDRQISTLSLIPTDNAASPMSQYIKGSELGNDFIGHNSAEHISRIEQIAAKRIAKVFGAETAIVRTGNAVAASRVVLMALLSPGDTVLSFNLRKSEHCTGGQMNYNFVKFAVNPDDLRIDFAALRQTALDIHPALIIYSPVNYPINVDIKKLRDIADAAGAMLWVDLGQNAGLVAAKKIPSPVPFADVVTFSASDGLHGPQNGVILAKSHLGEHLRKTVIDTGHASLKKNVMASLAITMREIESEEFEDYATAVLDNARALEKGLKQAGCQTLCAPTQNHLVLVGIPAGKDGATIETKAEEAGLLIKSETLMTSDDKISYPILRLSSLYPTTRSLNEEDMFTVGLTLGEFIKSNFTAHDIAAVKNIVKEMTENLPLFSEEWLPEGEIVPQQDTDLMLKAMIYGM